MVLVKKIEDKYIEKDLDKILEDLNKLLEYAKELGATDAKIITTDKIVIDERVRWKCLVPTCRWYGSSIHCPPYQPITPRIMKRIVNKYKYGIIIRLDAPKIEDFAGPDWVRAHIPIELKHKEIVGKIEAAAFDMGYHLAMGFTAGECSLCLSKNMKCTVLEGNPCRYPLQARPAMEAVGIDVFLTARNVGWDLYTIGSSSDPKFIPRASLIGLILIY
ncbi:MAG: DUF2284 domain-containing protein [Candidatus Methanomethyliaceae archaeon]|nr:DUF2284 domain-containing protein [Candidatus Methanomethyliaceae archaeon]